MTSHSGSKIALIVVTLVVHAIMLAMAGLASSQLGVDIGLYNQQTGQISDKFVIPITPASWTFSIWGFIFAWQIIWLIYVLTTICRTDSNGVHIYQLPMLTSPFFISYILNNAAVAAWLILWDREWMGWACLDIVFTVISVYTCLFFSFWKLYENLKRLRETGLSKEVWYIRIFVQNGIAFFSTWLTIATLLNFAIVLTYNWSVAVETAGIVSLSLLGAVITGWFTLETFVIDKYVRYTFSPYIVFVFALIGSLAKNFNLDTNKTISIFTVVLLVGATAFAILKVVVLIYRHRKFPIKGTIGDDVKGNLV